MRKRVVMRAAVTRRISQKSSASARRSIATHGSKKEGDGECRSTNTLRTPRASAADAVATVAKLNADGADGSQRILTATQLAAATDATAATIPPNAKAAVAVCGSS